jgi:hypothetical protein
MIGERQVTAPRQNPEFPDFEGFLALGSEIGFQFYRYGQAQGD